MGGRWNSGGEEGLRFGFWSITIYMQDEVIKRMYRPGGGREGGEEEEGGRWRSARPLPPRPFGRSGNPVDPSSQPRTGGRGALPSAPGGGTPFSWRDPPPPSLCASLEGGEERAEQL
ncbi:UNVERIFIED_CONTAM: hypothetical protein K2H54_019631 [Gekko kuhli]